MSTNPATLSDLIGGTPITQRGFTDHEHLDDAQLIHMNGRVYDYNLGRFLSVDPFIQAPGNSQSLNPYSYIMNNPLAGTDPSGYLWLAPGSLESNHCSFLCMVGYQGFTSAGSNGVEYAPKKALSFAADDEAEGDIGAPAGKDKLAAIKEICNDCDISEPPDNIKMAEGQSYDAMSDEEKYAMHITSQIMKDVFKRAEEGDFNVQTEAGQLNADHVNAVWYSDISGDNKWDFKESTFAKAEWRQGENIGFNGKRMLDLLPGGDGFDLTRASQAQKEAYVLFGPSQQGGLTALRMVISHELAHVTSENSSTIKKYGAARGERAASIVYFQLFGDS